MVKKVQKPKAASAKSSTSVKKTKSTKAASAPSTSVRKNKSSRTKKEEKIGNGFADNEVDLNEERSSVENIDIVVPETTENTNMEADVKPNNVRRKKLLASDGGKKVPMSRKRTTSDPEKKSAVKVKEAKKRKVLLQIPTLKSIVGNVFVIGQNDCGQLGFEDDDEKEIPTLLDLPYSIVDVAAGGMHSVCLTENGEVITFGCNDEGALGRITSEESEERTPRIVDLPERIVQVSAGDSHTAALSESGHIYVWGNFRGNSGPIGLVSTNTKQITPIQILNNTTIVQIASGSDHLAFLSQEGDVYTCGEGAAGQLGRVSEHSSENGGRRGIGLLLEPDIVPIGPAAKQSIVKNIWTGAYATFVKEQESGSMYAFGLNNFKQLGVEGNEKVFNPRKLSSFSDKTWSLIHGGQHHTLALDSNGLVYSLGRSEDGRLGLGDNCDVTSTPTLIPTLQDQKCVDISCGNCSSFAVTDNGSVYSWGFGENHQLGHGNDDDQSTPTRIGGNFLNSWKAIKISGGGQHTLILALPKRSLEESK